ncbi:MAG: phosphoserine phosphatase SerB [Halobacteriales archaeon]|nr:phosphoserine phosphatase SerB [Halobacteriales archaeon]
MDWGLVAFDFDGTLSDSEMTVLLGEQQGVAEDMSRITEQAMADEIEYATSLRRRAGLLEGLSVEAADRAFDAVELRPGTAAVISTIRDAGLRTAILTGGFERGVERALSRAETTVDRIIANRLPVADGTLTGEVEGPLIEGTKDDALGALAAEWNIDLAATVAVGDGANDLPMLETAGLAIGFQPKPAVEPACDLVVDSMAELQTALEDQNVI